MFVIADTSLLNYLFLIGQADLLPQLYGQIVIPRAVLREPDALLLIDDNAGRREAARHWIAITGTLGILNAAAAMGLVNLRQALDALLATNFHVSRRILRRLLDVDGP
jgi:predicted nucleic acid-binding protein